MSQLRPAPAATLDVEASASADGFDWAEPEDQRQCAAAPAYPEEVAGVLQPALQDECEPCRRRSHSFRLFLLGDPVGERATVVSLVLLDPDPESSARALETLSDILSHTTLPPLPGRGSRCSLDVSVTPVPVQ